ncbi:MAG: hypothetical protein PHS33_09525 [Candidatus Omnitrophica bacterium]|jgi:hypothetical protein|nr:hypothetical protein [Candidatus Omnitrophota bacterium]
MNEKEFEKKYPNGIRLDVTSFSDSERQYQPIQCCMCDNYAVYGHEQRNAPMLYFCDGHKPDQRQLLTQ